MRPETAYLLTFAMIIVMKIVCFVLGYLIIKLGYNLIKSGVQGQFKFSTNFAGFKADLASVSPGLLFVLLGVLLMGFAMYVEKEASLKYEAKPVMTVPPSPFGDSNKK